MSSTDDVRLRRFYEAHLEPAARLLRQRGVQFFPLGPDAGEESWYDTALPGDEFIRLDEADVGPALRALWQEQALPELADLVDALMALARELESAEEETPDISPFVYVMY